MEQQAQNLKDLLKTLLLTLLFSLWLYWLWSRRNLYRFAFKFPGHFGLPIAGSLFVIKDFKAILQALNLLFERCQSHSICVWFGLQPNVVSVDPEFIEKILSCPDLLNKANTSYTPVYQSFQGGIISSPASVWKHNRKAITPAFKHKVLVSFLPIFHNAKNDIMSIFDKMVDNGEHKLSELIHRLTLGITYETTMGKKMKPGDNVDEDFITKFKYIMETLVHHITLSYVNIGFLLLLNLRYQKAKKRCHQHVLELVTEKLNSINNKEKQQQATSTEDISTEESVTKSLNIFIDQAVENHNKNIFSLNDIIIESNNIVAASFETTANAIHAVLVMLATHPDVQERLFEEIVNIFPQKDFEMEYEHFDQLPYLGMVINETLRLAPSIPLIARQVTKDIQLSKDVVLPQGLEVVVSIFHVHRRQDIWGPNANNFDPNNFLPANMAGRHPYAYLPFSKGMRNCIGWRYALFAMKIILAGMVRNYRFSTTTKYEDIDFTFHVALKYKQDPSFSVYRRE